MFLLVVGSAHDFNVTNEDNTMTKDQKIIRINVGVLELAKQLGNVSQALAIWRLQAKKRQHQSHASKPSRLLMEIKAYFFKFQALLIRLAKKRYKCFPSRADVNCSFLAPQSHQSLRWVG